MQTIYVIRPAFVFRTMVLGGGPHILLSASAGDWELNGIAASKKLSFKQYRTNYAYSCCPAITH